MEHPFEIKVMINAVPEDTVEDIVEGIERYWQFSWQWTETTDDEDSSMTHVEGLGSVIIEDYAEANMQYESREYARRIAKHVRHAYTAPHVTMLSMVDSEDLTTSYSWVFPHLF